MNTELCPVSGWGPMTASSSKGSVWTRLEQASRASASPRPTTTTPTTRDLLEKKRQVKLALSYIQERTASQEAGSLERKKNYIAVSQEVLPLTVFNVCPGCNADVTGNWSRPAQPREGAGGSRTLGESAVRPYTQHSPCPGSEIVPYMDLGSRRQSH